MILIVDDMVEVSVWLRETIHEAGYFTDYALEAETALFKLARINYSMALIDILLPGGMRGDELAKEVKQLPEPFRSIPMVAMTGGDSLHNIELFVEMLHKPFLPRDLRTAIERHADPPIKDLHLAKQLENIISSTTTQPTKGEH